MKGLEPSGAGATIRCVNRFATSTKNNKQTLYYHGISLLSIINFFEITFAAIFSAFFSGEERSPAAKIWSAPQGAPSPPFVFYLRSAHSCQLLKMPPCHLMFQLIKNPVRSDGSDGATLEMAEIAADNKISFVPLSALGEQRVFVIGHR